MLQHRWRNIDVPTSIPPSNAPNRQKPQKSLTAKNPKNPQKISASQKNRNKNSRPTKIPNQQKSPHKMEHYEKLYDWINQNYSALQISYLNYDNKQNVNFTLYCIAMYVKHQSLFS
jgi:hypothetical protein